MKPTGLSHCTQDYDGAVYPSAPEINWEQHSVRLTKAERAAKEIKMNVEFPAYFWEADDWGMSPAVACNIQVNHQALDKPAEWKVPAYYVTVEYDDGSEAVWFYDSEHNLVEV